MELLVAAAEREQKRQLASSHDLSELTDTSHAKALESGEIGEEEVDEIIDYEEISDFGYGSMYGRGTQSEIRRVHFNRPDSEDPFDIEKGKEKAGKLGVRPSVNERLQTGEMTGLKPVHRVILKTRVASSKEEVGVKKSAEARTAQNPTSSLISDHPARKFQPYAAPPKVDMPTTNSKAKPASTVAAKGPSVHDHRKPSSSSRAIASTATAATSLRKKPRLTDCAEDLDDGEEDDQAISEGEDYGNQDEEDDNYDNEDDELEYEEEEDDDEEGVVVKKASQGKKRKAALKSTDDGKKQRKKPVKFSEDHVLAMLAFIVDQGETDDGSSVTKIVWKDVSAFMEKTYPGKGFDGNKICKNKFDGLKTKHTAYVKLQHTSGAEARDPPYFFELMDRIRRKATPTGEDVTFPEELAQNLRRAKTPAGGDQKTASTNSKAQSSVVAAGTSRSSEPLSSAAKPAAPGRSSQGSAALSNANKPQSQQNRGQENVLQNILNQASLNK